MSDFKSTPAPILLGMVQKIKYLQQILCVVIVVNLGSSQTPI